MSTPLAKAEIMAEVATLQYFYGLKYEIRYGLNREEKDFTESVAEHIYGMHILADYFKPYEDPQNTWDGQKIHTMITWHEVDELETGDIISWQKTAADIRNAKDAGERVLAKLPGVLRDPITIVIREYEGYESPEAKFVKAIDKIEPLLHLYNDRGKTWAHSVKLTLHNSVRIKEAYVAPFPTIKAFTDALHESMHAEGFFSA